MRRANHLRRRGAFTLVELLIVITILGIMFALTAAAVVRVLGQGDEVKTRSELSQLTMAVKAFQQDYQVSYMPDTLMLPPGTDQASRQYITSLWPRLNPALLNNDATGRAYWQAGAQQRVLRGHQTLVFFLGGYREGANATTGLGGDPVGFCTDPTNPMKPTGLNVTRKQPYYEFPSDRLRVYPPNNDATMPYPSFRDVYDKAPYLYFSSGSAGNDYSKVAVTFGYSDDTGRPATANVLPFMIRVASTGTSDRFANPSGFQIISAGRDTRFGVGGTTWAGGAGIGNNKDGADDVANFHPTKLGIAGN